MQQAEVYLIDEPSSYLDVGQRLRAARAIRTLIGPSTYVIVVEHDLSVLDYLSDSVCLCYGVRGAYGVCASSLGSREGINAFLSGYLPSENLRFRSEGLKFSPTSAAEAEANKPNQRGCEEEDHDNEAAAAEQNQQRRACRYPSLSKTLCGFSLRVEAGELRPGEITLLLGQNGMGKTLLVKMLAGQIMPDGGTQSGGALHLDLAVSYKPQHMAPTCGGTVRELLSRSIGDAIAHERFLADVAAPLRMEPLMDMQVKELSGGELQRLALCLCLGRPADLYLLDEPSAYLDSEQRVSVARMLKRFVAFTGTLCLVVEHDFMMSTYLADRVIVYQGTPAVEAVARSPQSLHAGMNQFLEGLNVTFRRDPETHRPRINKPDSTLDRDQKAAGNFFFMEEP